VAPRFGKIQVPKQRYQGVTSATPAFTVQLGLEMAVHAEAFAGGAEQRQKHDGEGVQKKKPIAPLWIGDA